MKRLITIMVLLLAGCASTEVNYSRESLKLELGMNKTQVLDIMGEPRRTDVDSKRERWVYWNATTIGLSKIDNEMMASDRLAITFVNGKVTKWGQSSYTADAMEASREMMEQSQKTMAELYKQGIKVEQTVIHKNEETPKQ